MAKAHTLDMTTGSIPKKFIKFIIPLVLTNLMQQLYTIADHAIVGRFAGDRSETALAAVGATSYATNLILNLLIGLSIGSSIVNSNLLGKRDYEGLRKSMHTGIPLGLIGGLLVGMAGFLLAPTMMTITNCPESIKSDAILYMRIICLGGPGTLIYNVGASILRTHGDSKRPMYIMFICGITNVILNLIFVVFCDMTVEGVALATLISKYLSAILVLLILFSKKHEYKMCFKELKLHAKECWDIIRVGIPCGINSTVFSISNTIVQTGINKFGQTVIAGSVASNNIVTLIYQVQAGIYSGCITFTGQNYGAQKYKRIDKLAGFATILCVGFSVIVSTIITIMPGTFIRLFNSDPAVVQAGINKLVLMAWSYVLLGFSEVLMGCLRGMRYTTVPSLLNILFVCGVRVCWVMFIADLIPGNEQFLYLCYPISYIFSTSAQAIYFMRKRKEMHSRQIAT